MESTFGASSACVALEVKAPFKNESIAASEGMFVYPLAKLSGKAK